MKSTLVMMGTYNGARFLGEQLESIAAQDEPDIDLLISDDGSTDSTRDILTRTAGSWTKGTVTIIDGPRRGFAENYRHLLLNAPGGYRAYAFSDQDDIWEDRKLSLANTWLRRLDEGLPGIFCGRTRIIDEKGVATGVSPLFSGTPSFRNAIVQSIAGANTMVMNGAARDLLCETCARTGFVSHDWWAYLVVTGAGGIVHYCADPLVSYRQHSGNIIGANSTWRARMVRLVLMAGGRFTRWNAENLRSLRLCEDLLAPAALEVMRDFEKIRGGRLIERMRLLRTSGIHRQTLFGQLTLHAACILGKI